MECGDVSPLSQSISAIKSADMSAHSKISFVGLVSGFIA
jgi:hypothetical protein